MSAHLILCEGIGDESVIRAILAHLGITHVDVREYGGCDNLKKFLPAFAASPEITRKQIRHLLVTRDNDDHPTSAWQSLADITRRAFSVELTVPSESVQTAEGLRVTGFAIPGSGVPGMIETLCINSLDPAGAEIQCLNSFVTCLQTAGFTIHEKAKFNAWVSTQPTFRELKNIMKAVEAAHFDFDSVAFRPIVECITKFAGTK